MSATDSASNPSATANSGCATSDGSAPTWQECENHFLEMSAAFGKDMVKYRELAAAYNQMLEAFEREDDRREPNAELRRGGPPPLPPASGSAAEITENPNKMRLKINAESASADMRLYAILSADGNGQ